MRRLLCFIAVIACAAAATASTASADGLPVLGVDVGWTGVSDPTGDFRYVTLTAGKRTVVARIRGRQADIGWATAVPGSFTIPAVSYDGTADGLSADGRTLVLIEPRASFPRAQTTMAVMRTGTAIRFDRVIRLRGDFSFDAISPGGRLVYLIQYLSPDDPNRYAVRVYDLDKRRLLPKPIVDPFEPDEEMGGRPLARVRSANQRWAFTLYEGPHGAFVHALDTVMATARCIDLPKLAGDSSGWRLALSRDGTRLRVAGHVAVDTRTFTVS